MISLLRSDLYRAVRSRWLWVAIGLVALLQLGSALSTIWWPLDPTLVFDGLTGPAGALRLAGHGSSIYLVTFVATFLAAHLSCTDSGSGFDRTLLSSLRGRGGYFAEKYLFAVLVSGTVLLAYLMFGGLGVLVAGVPVHNVEPLWQVAAWAACEWLVACAYALLVMFVGQLFHSRVLAFVLAFMLMTGMAAQVVYGLAVFVCSILGQDWSPMAEQVVTWMPYAASVAVNQGASELFAVDATGLAPALRTLAVCAPLALLVAGAGVVVGTRRDVA